MRAMILAAGRGERMRPLTDHTPKPLLTVGGKPLIVWHLERLAAAGFDEIVINHAHLGGQIEAALGSGASWGVRIAYSPEAPAALETAGGIFQALPLLGDGAFLVVNGDVWCDWDFRRARRVALGADRLAHLVMVANPAHHAGGDFALAIDQAAPERLLLQAATDGEPALTYSGIGIFHPELFAGMTRGTALKLRPLLDRAIARRQASGELHAGGWTDVGTPARLTALDQALRAALSPDGR